MVYTTVVIGFWKKNWGKLLLGGVLLWVVAVNFRWGYWILGNDNYSPEENPGVSFERYLKSPTWRAYRGLGVPSDAEQIDVFRSGMFLILEKVGVPLWLVSQMSVWLTLAAGVMGMGWLAKKLHGGEGAFLAGGIIYFSSILTLWLFFSPLKPFVFFWGFLPVFLAATWELLERDSLKNWVFWILSMVAFGGAFVIPTLFLVSVIVLGLMGVVFGLKSGKWRGLGVLGLIFLIWQLYWLVPFGFYVKEQSGQLQDSFINRAITSGTVQDEKEYGRSPNVLRLMTSWVALKNDDGEQLFGYEDWYRGAAATVLGFVPMGLAVLGLSKRKYVLVLVGMAGMGAWLLLNSNPPLGWFYDWCSRSMPLFRQVFRWGSSKFWVIWWLPVVILATGGWGRLWRRDRWLSMIVLTGLLVYMYPAFVRRLINERDWVRIPREYYELREYLRRVDTKGRVYLAPEANMLYFRNHDWGFFGSVFWSYWIPNPIVEKALVTGSAENEEAFKKIVNFYYADDPVLFVKILNNAGVGWVIGDRSLTDKGNGYRYNWKTYAIVMEENPYLKKVWQKGNLELFEVGRVDYGVWGNGENLVLDLGEGKAFGDGVEITDDGYRVKNRRSVSGVYWEISDPEIGGRLLKISAQVENKSGIIGEINLRETKKQYQTFSYLGKMGEEEAILGYVYLPRDWRNYLLEFVVKARGPDESINRIKNLKLESVPLTEDYLKIRMPEAGRWEKMRYLTYAGWTINALVIVVLVVRQKLKSRKVSLSGSKKTTAA